MKQQILRVLIPFIVLATIFILLWQTLNTKQNAKESPLVGKRFPAFSLPDLYKPKIKLNQNNIKGKVSLVNIWASWCFTCEIEQPMLMQISKQYHIPIYGIDYKDKPSDAKKWLRQHGNPFTRIISDQDGDLAIDLGIYGTPETFVVANGDIVFRHTGAINQENWEKIIYPIVKWYQA